MHGVVGLMRLYDALAQSCLVQASGTMPGPSQSQLDAFARGVIVGMAAAGARSAVIARAVKKSDGTHPSKRAVNWTVQKAKAHRTWCGTRKPGSGRPATLPNYATCVKDREEGSWVDDFC